MSELTALYIVVTVSTVTHALSLVVWYLRRIEKREEQRYISALRGIIRENEQQIAALKRALEG